jgi:hypothetical protein
VILYRKYVSAIFQKESGKRSFVIAFLLRKGSDNYQLKRRDIMFRLFPIIYIFIVQYSMTVAMHGQAPRRAHVPLLPLPPLQNL